MMLWILFNPILLEAQKPIVRVQLGSKNVNSVAFSPDGSKIFTGSSEGLIKVWNSETGVDVFAFKGHNYPVYSIAISKDGKKMISGGGDYYKPGEIILWDIILGKEIKRFMGHTDLVNSVAFSPDGSKIVSSGDDRFLKVWSIESGEQILSINLHPFKSFAAIFSPDGKTIVEVGQSCRIRLFDAISGNELEKLPEQDFWLTSVAFSPDGKKLVTASKSIIKIWDFTTKKEIKTINCYPEEVHSVIFSKDGNSLISSNRDKLNLLNIEKGTISLSYGNFIAPPFTGFALSPDGKKIMAARTLLDFETAEIIWKFESHFYLMDPAALFPNGKEIITNHSHNAIKILNIEQFKDVRVFEGAEGPVAISSDGKRFVCQTQMGTDLLLYDAQSGEIIKRYVGHNSAFIKSIAFSQDEKLIISTGEDFIGIWNVESEKILTTIPYNSDYPLWNTSLSHDNSKIVCKDKDIPVYLLDIKTGNKLWKYNVFHEFSTYPHYTTFSPDESTILASGDRSIYLLNAKTGEEIWVKAINGGKAIFSPDGSKIVSSAGIIDAKTGDLIYQFIDFTPDPIAFFPDGKKVLLANYFYMSIWDIEKYEEIIKYIQFEDNEWFVSTTDGYFDGSLKGGRYVPIVQGLNGWPLDQFAIKYNRPDIIATRLGVEDKDQINVFYNQYQKRLRKFGLTEAQLDADLHAPKATIKGRKQEGKYIDLTFTLSDSKYNLKKYNIFVNEVPLFGAFGKVVTGKTITLTERIELTDGDNKIEVTCINEKGNESFRNQIFAKYQFYKQNDLYFLAFGVSKYQNPALNLQFADKDAIDLEKVIQNLKSKGFENVYSKVLINEQVTPDAIKASKDFVKNAKPDDTFILFIAGHGLHDKDAEATYYYLTYNADVTNLKATAADFETIEDLLQGIPPRNKLFLMDACESGEIDEEDQGQMLAAATGVGIASRGFKSVSSLPQSQPQPKRSYLYQKDRYIYNDLVRRSGAIVFSSSKGGELSYERSDIENGLFTEYIMKALTTTEADKDGDGTVSTDELRQYVSEQVAKASGDLQHPTVDRDNIYQKFGFSIR